MGSTSAPRPPFRYPNFSSWDYHALHEIKKTLEGHSACAVLGVPTYPPCAHPTSEIHPQSRNITDGDQSDIPRPLINSYSLYTTF